MKKIILFSILFLSYALPSLARIDETVAQCEARYGKPVEKPIERGALLRRSYRTDTYAILIDFKGDKAVVISYQLKDNQKMSLKRIETLLRQNAVGRFEASARPKKTWYFEVRKQQDEAIKLRSEDNKTFAAYFLRNNVLTISSSVIQ